MRACIYPLLLLGVLTKGAQAQRPASASELDAIAARGRVLADYDATAWRATDEVMALKPPTGAVTHYVARRAERGWRVSFGHLNATRDTFLVTYTAAQAADPSSLSVITYVPPPEAEHIFPRDGRGAYKRRDGA